MYEEKNLSKNMEEDISNENYENLLETLEIEAQILWSNAKNTTPLDSLTCKVEIW